MWFDSIPPELIQVFKEAKERSFDTNKEVSAVFCMDKDGFIIDRMQDGGEDSASLAECPHYTTYFADFHTHPVSRKLAPSSVDTISNIQLSFLYNRPIRSCIGAPYMDNFYCFEPKDTISEGQFLAASAMKKDAFIHRDTPKWFGEVMTADVFNEEGGLIPRDEFRASLTSPDADDVACLPDTDDDERLTDIFKPYCKELQISLPDHEVTDRCVRELKEQRKYCTRKQE